MEMTQDLINGNVFLPFGFLILSSLGAFSLVITYQTGRYRVSYVNKLIPVGYYTRPV